MDYQQTIDYLYAQLPMFHRIGPAAYKADLSNTIALANHLNNPHKKFKSIHIAGTNGKGSVASLLASIFQQAGYKTGLCTSPHLVDFRERFKVNGQLMERDFLVEFVNKHKSFFEQIKPSFFEMTIAMAFDYFDQHKVDIAIIETGLGGRLDSTNIILPEISVITNIGFDHTNLLGNTLEKIAAEKAGIIKPNIPFVLGKTRKNAQNVILQKAREMDSHVTLADETYNASGVKTRNSHLQPLLSFTLSSPRKIRNIESPLTASCQIENITTAVATIDTLQSMGKFSISEKHLLDGIRNVIDNTGLKGRWQILHKKPLVICDTGHNEDGVKTILDNISRTPHHHLHFVLGLMNDKDLNAILNLLPAQNTTYYFCRPNVPRGLDVTVLQKTAASYNLHGDQYPSVQNALSTAMKKASANDLVFVGGSTFVVAEVVT